MVFDSISRGRSEVLFILITVFHHAGKLWWRYIGRLTEFALPQSLGCARSDVVTGRANYLGAEGDTLHPKCGSVQKFKVSRP
jgi:hypothetical protein